MQISISKTPVSTYNSQGTSSDVKVEVTHNDRTLFWNVSSTWKREVFTAHLFGDGGDVFEYINLFWQTLPEQTHDEMFKIYEDIQEIFQESLDLDILLDVLQERVAQLLNLHQLAAVHHWVVFHSGIRIPGDFHESYTPNELRPGTREKTYLVDDYRWLIAIAIVLRPIIPIWGEFIARARNELGTAMKEFFALEILETSDLFKDPAWLRLQTYVRVSIPDDKTRNAAIINAVGTQDFPKWMLAMVVVRKLCIHDVAGRVEGSTLISSIFNYVKQKTRQNDAAFGGAIHDKIDKSTNATEENKVSKLEAYRERMALSIGQVESLHKWALDPIQVAKRVDPTIDSETIGTAMTACLPLMQYTLADVQIRLTQWILAQSIPPKAIDLLKAPARVAAVSAAVALYWHWGFKELAGFAGAVCLSEDSDDIVEEDIKLRVPKEVLDKVLSYYPFEKKSSSRSKNAKATYPIVALIDETASELSSKAWRLTLPATWLGQVTGNQRQRNHSPSADIRIQLSQFIIELNERKERAFLARAGASAS